MLVMLPLSIARVEAAPEHAEATVSHDVLLVAVQAQTGAVTLTVPPPVPAA
jgi:hypothetical protein